MAAGSHEPAASSTSASNTSLAQPGGVDQRRVPPLDGLPERMPEVARVGAGRVRGVRHPERDVPRLVAQREPGHVRGDRIRRVAVQEAQQVHERALAEDGEQGSWRS